MRLMALATAAAIALCAVTAADAQDNRTRRTVQPQTGPGTTHVRHTDETGRTRTKILVQKRSYLDGGTEVMPGDVSTNRDNLINSFYYAPSRSSVSNDNIVPSRPIPDPFFLPGKENPFFR
jgi:hypothetical protein